MPLKWSSSLKLVKLTIAEQHNPGNKEGVRGCHRERQRQRQRERESESEGSKEASKEGWMEGRMEGQTGILITHAHNHIYIYNNYIKSRVSPTCEAFCACNKWRRKRIKGE